MRSIALAAALTVFAAVPAVADRTVQFTVSQGTWMNVDISPDGQTVVFDVLGDLYTLPIAGGTAKRITDGRAFDTQARWSPDGKRIAFSSDRSGADNIWTVAPDGSEPAALTAEKAGGLTAPAWTPDGQYLVARRDPTYNRRGSAELWMYHRSGGTGVRLTRREDEGGLNPNGPVVSRDGRYVYFAHGYRVLDSTWGPWQVWRVDRRAGGLTQITTGYTGAVRPTLTPDGTTLLFVRRDHAKSALVARELATGQERVVATGLDRDDQRGTTDYDAYPGFAVMPDGKSVVIGTRGGLHRIDLATGADASIPFTADVSLSLADPARTDIALPDDPVTARIIRSASFTPDGSAVVFESLGRIWMQRGSEAPRRLTGDAHREYGPAVSPDGKWVAYVSWDDRRRGHVWKLALPDGAPQQLTKVAREYANPAWSPDGTKLVVSWRAPNYGNTANVTEDDPAHDIVWLPASGGDTETIASVKPRNAGRWLPAPRFDAEGERVFFIVGASTTRNDLVSVRLDGTDRRTHLRFRYVEDAAPSPDGKRVAFVSMDDLYVVALPDGAGELVDLDLQRPALPVETITRDGGGYPAWIGGGRELTWCYASVAYRRPDGGAVTSVPVKLTAPRAMGTGSTLYTGARILTMRGEEVLERGDLLVTGRRIAAVGRSGSLTVPAGTTRVSVTGRTIVPGLVDPHWHGHYSRQDIYPQQKWQYLADLASGVTTGREVSAPTRDTMGQADLVETGDMAGPRVFGTGWPLFSAGEGGGNQVAQIDSLDDARRHVRRLKRSGVTYLKQYLQPRREQRAWLQQAAREEGVMITAEGGGFRVQMTMVMDGFTGFEHGIPVAPIYDDVIQLLAKAGTVYTPTFVAGYAKPGSMDYYYARENVHADPIASTFTPHDLLDRFTEIRVLIPEDEYLFKTAAKGAVAVGAAGGNVAVGGHGNHPGLGTHWELWSFVEGGGMSPMAALRAATMGGAEALGIAKEVGSIEPGKIADFIVLDGDPRKDIHQSRSVRTVVKDGRPFDPAALAKLLPWQP